MDFWIDLVAIGIGLTLLGRASCGGGAISRLGTRMAGDGDEARVLDPVGSRAAAAAERTAPRSAEAEAEAPADSVDEFPDPPGPGHSASAATVGGGCLTAFLSFISGCRVIPRARRCFNSPRCSASLLSPASRTAQWNNRTSSLARQITFKATSSQKLTIMLIIVIDKCENIKILLKTKHMFLK